MRKIFVSSLVFLALAAWTMAPGFAAEVEPPAPDEPTQIDLPVEEPVMTPTEDPETLDLLDPSQGTLEKKIRACEPWEAEQYCAPGCDCVITASNVYCFC